ncbi:MAG: GIY-YIG nuclease family protein [Phycisphaerae bacterium]|nr:GIY-YIG nuclease family protein [Gemmatimonadaceae bacterium]
MIARATAAARQLLQTAKPPSAQLTFDVGSSATDVGHLREIVRANAANKPGVYRMRNTHGELLYVGKSKHIRTRLLSYFRLPWPEHRHARMLRETSVIEWDYISNEFGALLREVRLIRSYLPRYNIRSARPLDKWWVISIGEGPAPRLRVQRASVAAASRNARGSVIGPFANRRVLVEALRVLNDALGLRDCTERVRLILRDAGDLFDERYHPALVRKPGCHRYETRRCLGPCVSGCSSSEYQVQLSRARAVLEGRDNSPQQLLMDEMSAASAALSYERAGWLRDRLAALQSLEAQLMRVREALSKPTCTYAVPGAAGDHWLYLIKDGRVAGEASLHDPGAIARLEALEQSPSTSVAISPHADQLDELLMIEQWFRTRPGEHAFTSPTVRQALAHFHQSVLPAE